ncbi:bax inhibitor 1-like [Drosophila sulfurigaster albostrigata]|uniref:bax inhibitor 1-like n=1 Tax=Drosophila sulfurigaster albostrigata TaxID=89887 RepID=UPI002D21CBE0|nr:bax inhibitor 1-like [Drosophila sulfurigaster albostrigata]
MANTAKNSNHSFERFVNSFDDRYEPYIRQHLFKVYMVLASTTAVAAGGALLQMNNYIDLGMLAAIAGVVLLLGLLCYDDDDGKNYYTRLGMLYALGFCCGQILGPPLGHIVSINPAIILTALTGTFVIFASLSLAALLSKQGSFLYLGGMLFSVLNCMLLLSLFNMIFKSYFVQITELYVGLFVKAAFIVYDTQNIVEKCRSGNRDAVQHALDLYINVLGIFCRLLIILTKKEEQKKAEEEEAKKKKKK